MSGDQDIPSPLWNAIDGYPRVMRVTPDSHGHARFEGYFDGAYKVVPADAIVTLQSERRSLPQVCYDLGVKVVGKDAVVIESGELPEVRNLPAMQRFEAGQCYADWDDEPEYFEARAREFTALAVRLREERDRPPVDESQVSSLASDLSLAMGIPNDSDAVARRLVEQGWTKQQGGES